MKLFLPYFLYFSCCITASLFAQIDTGILNCGSSELSASPELQLCQDSLDGAVRRQHINAGNETGRTSPPPYVLPIVFHVIHDGGEENLPEADILRSLEYVNQAFANTDYYDQGTGADTRIQFCLAQRTPDNQPTTGITYHQNALTDVDFSIPGQDEAMKDLARWDPLQYINVYVIRDACGAGGCNVIGYAYLPSAHGDDIDGIVVESFLLANDEADIATLAHELGHYLGLYHTFDGGCNNDDCTVDGDQVCDTPPDQSTVAVPCSGVVNSCNTDTNSGFATDQNDLFNNYMDYGFRACRNAFTQGQAERMHSFIDGVRSSLLESQGCLPPCNDLVEATFSSIPATTSVPFETNVTFTAQGNNVTEYAWYINGELVSTASTFTYFFDQAGEAEIRLEASGIAGCGLIGTIRDYSVVCDNPADYTTITPQIQAGNTVAYVATALVADTYRWTLDGTEIGSSPEVIIPFTTVGIARLCLETTLNGCTAENCEIVYVAPSGTVIGEGCQAATFLSNYPQPGNGELYHGAITFNSDGSYWQTGIIRDGDEGDFVILQRLSATGEIQYSGLLNDFGSQNLNAIPAARELSNGDLLLLVNGFGSSDPGDYIVRFSLATEQEVYRIRVADSGNGQQLRNLIPIPQQTDQFLVMAQRLPGGNNGSFTVKTVLFDLDANSGTYDETWRYRAAGPTGKVHALDDGAFWPDGKFRGIGTFEREEFGLRKRPGISIFSAPNVLAEQFTYHRPSSENVFLRGNQLLPGSTNWYSTHYGNHLGFINPGGVSSYLNGWNVNNEIQWTRRYRPAGTESFNIMGSVQVGETLYHSGFMQENNGSIKLFCFATNNLGEVLWANTYADGQVDQLFVNSGPTATNAIVTDGSRLTIPFTSTTAGGSLGLLMINLDGSFVDPCLSPVSLDLPSEDLTTSQEDFDNPDLIIGENKFDAPVQPAVAGEEIRLNGCAEPCDNGEEICGNGIDDDGNGLTDCDDPAIANSCCCQPLPFVVLPPDTVICPGSGYVLRPIAVTQQTLLLWSTNATTDSIIIDQPGTYFVSLTDSCGIMATDSIVITSPALPSVPDLGPDFAVCENGVFTLNAGPGFLRYEWPDLTTESTATFDEPGIYYVRVFNECGEFSADSVTVTIAPETNLELPDSVGLCSGATVLLSTAGFGANQWFDETGTLVCTNCPDSLVTAPQLGDTIKLVIVAQNDQGCYSSDTSVIFQQILEGNFIEASICNEEQFSFGNSTYSAAGEYYAGNNCGGQDTLLLSVVFPENEYELRATLPLCPGEFSGLITVNPPGLGTELSLASNNSSGIDTLTGLSAGSYLVNVTDFRGCTYTEEVTIPENRDFTVLLPPDTLVRLGEEVTLQPLLLGLDLTGATFRWEPAIFLNCDTCFSVTARPGEELTYELTVTSAIGCEQSTTISIQLDRRERIYVPTAFSPDGDGINDNFFPNCGPEVTEIVDFQVFDRWGGLRYSATNLTPNDPATGWDGTSGGELQSSGIFVYRVSARLLDGRLVTIAGDVMLMR